MKRQHKLQRRQRGAALITAMLVTALASIAAVEMMGRQQLDIRRAGNVMESGQAWLFALGVESWAVEVLRRDRLDSNTDHEGEDWATVLPAIAVEGAMVAGVLQDQQGRVNLNNLINEFDERSEADVAILQRLLRSLELDEELALVVADWVDSDAEAAFPAGAEDNEYLAMEPRPYRSANALMASVSELRLIQGITAEVYEALQPHVTVLPARTAVNVNTAGAEVLMAVVEGLTRSDAERIISDREENPFETLDDFSKHEVVRNRLKNNDGISVSSDYFMIRARVEYGRNRSRLNSLIQRSAHTLWVIQRSRGQV